VWESRAEEWGKMEAKESRRGLGETSAGCAGVVSLCALVLCIAAFGWSLLDVPGNNCAMTYMWPNYLRIPVPHAAWGTRTSYSLYLYREGHGVSSSVGDLPVLFIPGNAGSGKQVRSLGAQAHRDLEDLVQRGGASGRRPVELDFWAVDFEEELSALSGGDLAAQARFVCKTIPFILSKYQSGPRGVVLVGHSMGGIIARLVAGPFCDAHHEPASAAGDVKVVAVLTVATPHTGLPAGEHQALNPKPQPRPQTPTHKHTRGSLSHASETPYTRLGCNPKSQIPNPKHQTLNTVFLSLSQLPIPSSEACSHPAWPFGAPLSSAITRFRIRVRFTRFWIRFRVRPFGAPLSSANTKVLLSGFGFRVSGFGFRVSGF
jgi:pimeloyl-ACP methyl ester carboxylesterase